jgi:hypothetical protein
MAVQGISKALSPQGDIRQLPETQACRRRREPRPTRGSWVSAKG